MDDTAIRRGYLQLQKDALISAAFVAYNNADLLDANRGRVDALYESMAAIDRELLTITTKDERVETPAIMQNYPKTGDQK